ncbi:MAG: hypothetical protein HRT47_09430 [Candidatus Caenarcaniphilales bacterium]|nr:hypothetical protein [Candidatus Caenarcaniphilales bacterium]
MSLRRINPFSQKTITQEERRKLIEQDKLIPLRQGVSLKRSLINLKLLALDEQIEAPESHKHLGYLKSITGINTENKDLWKKLGIYEKNKIKTYFINNLSQKELLTLKEIFNTVYKHKKHAVWHFFSLILNDKNDTIKNKIKAFERTKEKELEHKKLSSEILNLVNNKFNLNLSQFEYHLLDPFRGEGNKINRSHREILKLIKPQHPVVEKKFSFLIPYYKHNHQVTVRSSPGTNKLRFKVRDLETNLQHYFFKTPDRDESLDYIFDIDLETGDFDIVEDNSAKVKKPKSDREKIGLAMSFIFRTLHGGYSPGLGQGPVISEKDIDGNVNHRQTLYTGLNDNEIEALGILGELA